MFKIKIILSIICLILTIIGWFISHGGEINWVKHLLARKYMVAVEVYENMIKNKSLIKEGDPGFQQIAAILSEKLQGSGDLTISKIRIIDHAFSIKSFDTGMKSIPTIKIEIILRDGRTTQASSMNDLRAELEKRYFKKAIFKSGAFIFWVGIITGVISLFVGQRTKQ